MNKEQLLKLGDRVFCETFKSMQLINFTVLYYNFNFDKEKLIEFNNRLTKANEVLLDDEVLYDKTLEKVSKILGVPVRKMIREFPYRSRVSMMGGFPKAKTMDSMNMCNLESFSAVESLTMLTFYVMMNWEKWAKHK